MDQLVNFLAGIGASLVAAALAAIVAYLFRGERYKRRVAAAPKIYVDHLGVLIMAAVREGPHRALINARAIVAARDDLRDSLLSVAHLLNNEIDKLANLSGGGSSFAANNWNGEPEYNDEREIYDLIEILWKKWPSKVDQIEIALRKMLAELGLDRA